MPPKRTSELSRRLRSVRRIAARLKSNSVKSDSEQILYRHASTWVAQFAIDLEELALGILAVTYCKCWWLRRHEGQLSVGYKNAAFAAINSSHDRVFGLDLARALAVTGVLEAHFVGSLVFLYGLNAPRIVSLSGHGVELFFALSGFLIGAILLDISERSPTPRGWLLFLTRRWMRTVPLYFLWIMVLLYLANGHIPHLLRYLTFTQNFAWPMPVAGEFPVSWSLTVEEWFYLLFSATLLGIASLWPRRALLVTCATFIVVPILLRFAFGDVANPEEGLRKIAIFRLDAIAYGTAMVAICRAYPQGIRRLRLVLLVAGLAMVVLTPFLPTTAVWTTLMYTYYPLGMALCLPAMTDLSPPTWRIAALAIRWLSTRSYSIYLVHLTFLEIALRKISSGSISGKWGLLAALGATFVVADILHRCVELPIMKLRPQQFPQRQSNAVLLETTGVSVAGATKAR